MDEREIIIEVGKVIETQLKRFEANKSLPVLEKASTLLEFVEIYEDLDREHYESLNAAIGMFLFDGDWNCDLSPEEEFLLYQRFFQANLYLDTLNREVWHNPSVLKINPDAPMLEWLTFLLIDAHIGGMPSEIFFLKEQLPESVMNRKWIPRLSSYGTHQN